ncbi:MAG: hypothetical protein MN733_14935 [Nitrososphaera sp.]|nr:hypothetical protein [Nitrososphaera sp.]
MRGNWNTDPSQGVHDILFWVKKDDPRSGQGGNPYSDSQFPYWDYPVQVWAQSTIYGNASSTPPTSSTSTPTTSTIKGFSIASPLSGATVSGQTPLIFSINTNEQDSILSVGYTLNGFPVGSSNTPPHYVVSVSSNSRGPTSLQVTVKYKDGQSETKSTSFTIQ